MLAASENTAPDNMIGKKLQALAGLLARFSS